MSTYSTQNYRPYNNYQNQQQNHYQQQDNRSADTGRVIQYLVYADNGDGQFNRHEEQLAMRLAAQSGDQRSSEVIGTALHGGVHGNGLKVDVDGNGHSSAAEWVDLANQDGNYHNITPQDFQKAFPNEAKPGGNSFDPYQNNQSNNHYNNGQNNGNQANRSQDPKQILRLLLHLLMSVLGDGGNNQQQGPLTQQLRRY